MYAEETATPYESRTNEESSKPGRQDRLPFHGFQDAKSATDGTVTATT